jgi:hypothetical protein
MTTILLGPKRDQDTPKLHSLKLKSGIFFTAESVRRKKLLTATDAGGREEDRRRKEEDGR